MRLLAFEAGKRRVRLLQEIDMNPLLKSALGPWALGAALMAGSARHLAPGGVLIYEFFFMVNESYGM